MRAALTPQQTEAVELGDGAHLITAPRGSGKTEVLVQRVMHLLDGSPRDLFRILALTYTAGAARELDERVRKIVPERDLWQVNVTTFHSFGLGILENYGGPVGLKHPITVISHVEDKRLLLMRLLDDREKPFSPIAVVDHHHWRSLFDEIAKRKANLEPPEQVENVWMLDGQVSLQEAYEAYETALAAAGSVDHEGMIFQTEKLIRINPWVGSHIRGQYRHILVDEGQELTRGQYELLTTIRGDTKTNVFVVADADQSANSFAGGGPRFLREFVSDFDASERNLTTNFRTAEAIVDILGSLRPHIGRPHEPARTSAGRLARGWVGARSYADQESEGRAVGEWIRSVLKEGLDPDWVYRGEATEVAPEDCCVLGRTRYSFGAVIADLEDHGLRFSLRTEERALFESYLGRSALYALKLTENPGDLPSKRRLLDELGTKTPTDPVWSESGLPWSILEDGARRGRLSRDFVEAFASTDDAPASGLQTVSALIGVDSIGIESNPEEEAAWHRDRLFLQQLLDRYEAGRSRPYRSLSGFLRMLSRLAGGAPSEPGIRILTPHRARGLGFKVVIVLGMNEGTFPYYGARSPDELDEERRVLYVAAGRAARALLLTRPRQQQSGHGPWRRPASRFIREMGLTMEYVP